MRKHILGTILVALALVLGATHLQAAKIKFAFVFIDRFPEASAKLGFEPGFVVQVGAIVKAGDSPIIDATATNLDTGLVLKLASRNIGSIYKNLVFLHNPFPPFDPGKHLGTWQVKIEDEKGNESVANTHRLDKSDPLPYVENIKASGDPLAPVITWQVPDQSQYPSECKLKFKVRLLKSNVEQFYATKKGTTEPRDQIPAGFLKEDDIADTYVRIETQCWDTADVDQPVPVELKSETFRPLAEALEQ